jgi:maleylpyruvate isomerase
MQAPATDLARVAAAHRRCFEITGRLTDEDVRRPSLLAGWSVGHVLAHLARNADSHVRRTEAALAGDVVDQYAGGMAGREAEIDAGARRSAAALAEDVRTSALAVEAAWRDVPPAAWAGRSRDANGQVRYLFELPGRRWQEVEVHLVDLAVGVGVGDWSDEFVAEWLPRTRERIWATLAGAGAYPVFDSPAEELAWLYGRMQRDDVPPPPAWG